MALMVLRVISLPVHDPDPLTPEQQRAAQKLLRSALADFLRTADDLARLFTREGHELALVGGPVRDVFLQRPHRDLDFATDAPPERVLEITRDWADASWSVGIAFGTIGLAKGKTHFEITTYRSERYDRN